VLKEKQFHYDVKKETKKEIFMSMQARHYEEIAEILAKMPRRRHSHMAIVKHFATELEKRYNGGYSFKRDRFIEASTRDRGFFS